jgi:hypothetical protein
MSEQERYDIAKAYIDKQMKTMEENGLRVKKVTASEYDQLVRSVAENVTSAGHSKSANNS